MKEPREVLHETLLFVFMVLLVVASFGGAVVVFQTPILVVLVAPLTAVYGWWFRLLLDAWARVHCGKEPF